MTQSLIPIQNCGICYKGASANSCSDSQQPELDGSTRLRSRSKVYPSHIYCGIECAEVGTRTAKRNHDLSAQPEAAAATVAECKAVTAAAAAAAAVVAAAMVVLPVEEVVAWLAAIARSMCPTFVHSHPFQC